MGVDTKIRLPLHVKADRVLKVIGKLVGLNHDQRTFPEQKHHFRSGKMETVSTERPFDGTRPSSKENPWRIEFPREEKALRMEPIEHDFSYGNFHFHDAVGETYRWMFFHEVETEDGKLLNPRASTVAVAVGKRLVDFFGGDVEYSDATGDISHTVDPLAAVFPPPSSTRSPDGDDRWYQFQNALHNFPALTLDEMLQAQQHSSYHGERDQKLMDYLEVQARAQALTEAVEAVEDPSPALRKKKPRL